VGAEASRQGRQDAAHAAVPVLPLSPREALPSLHLLPDEVQFVEVIIEDFQPLKNLREADLFTGCLSREGVGQGRVELTAMQGADYPPFPMWPWPGNPTSASGVALRPPRCVACSCCPTIAFLSVHGPRACCRRGRREAGGARRRARPACAGAGRVRGAARLRPAAWRRRMQRAPWPRLLRSALPSTCLVWTGGDALQPPPRPSLRGRGASRAAGWAGAGPAGGRSPVAAASESRAPVTPQSPQSGGVRGAV